jgi:iron complex outermembrane receptor protein
VKLGNADLEPETIETLELAFNYQITSDLYGALNLFHYQINDKIDYATTEGVSTIQAQNLGTQKGRGVELEIRWQPYPDLDLLGNYAFQQITDEEHDHDAGNVPQQQVYLRGDWLFATDWHLNTQLNWVGERERVFGDPRAPVADYTWIDLTFKYKRPKSAYGFTMGVRNLLDSDAREPSLGPNASGVVNIPYDLPLAGRHYFLEMNYQF